MRLASRLVFAFLATLGAASLFTPPVQGAAFTPGNLVIYRVGDGSAALVATGTAVFLDEYTTAGVLVQSIPVPTTTVGAQRRVVCSGSATTEGFLTRSTDGQYVVFSGYDAALGAAVTTSTSAAVPRVIGRVAPNGTLDTTTALTDAISGGNPRSAASTNGTDLWLSGTSTGGGIRYATLGATTSTSLATTPTNLRALGIFGGQLYTSSQSGAFRLATIGTGTPTTAGQTITNLPGFPTATGSPIAFFFADLDAGVAGVDTVYVADDGGTVQKYSLVSGSWTANGTIALATARGITGTVSGSNVTLYVTARTTLRTLTDTSGYNATITGSVTTLATAATNTAMQGVAFVPVINAPNLTINDVSLNEGNAGTTTLHLHGQPLGAGRRRRRHLRHRHRRRHGPGRQSRRHRGQRLRRQVLDWADHPRRELDLHLQRRRQRRHHPGDERDLLRQRHQHHRRQSVTDGQGQGTIVKRRCGPEPDDRRRLAQRGQRRHHHLHLHGQPLGAGRCRRGDASTSPPRTAPPRTTTRSPRTTTTSRSRSPARRSPPAARPTPSTSWSTATPPPSRTRPSSSTSPTSPTPSAPTARVRARSSTTT